MQISDYQVRRTAFYSMFITSGDNSGNMKIT